MTKNCQKMRVRGCKIMFDNVRLCNIMFDIFFGQIRQTSIACCKSLILQEANCNLCSFALSPNNKRNRQNRQNRQKEKII